MEPLPKISPIVKRRLASPYWRAFWWDEMDKFHKEHGYKIVRLVDVETGTAVMGKHYNAD